MRQVSCTKPGDVAVEQRDDPTITRADRRDHPAVGHLHLRVRPVALPRRRAGRRARADGPRVRRRRRGDRLRRPTIQPGHFVVGSFFASDNTCEICRAGYQSRCVHARA